MPPASTPTSARPSVSVTIPVYNEEANVDELLSRVGKVLDEIPGGPHQIVCVDDGSRDRTVPMLEAIAAKDPRLTILSLSRNFGHQAAITAGLDYVTGDVVVVMDGDLQDAPEAIPAFLEKHAEGFDVVYAIRMDRKESFWLRACYALFYRLMGAMSDIHIPNQAGDFGLMSRRAVHHLRKIPERNRYVRGLRTWIGFPQTGVKIERLARFAGQPKYSFSRLVGLALEGLFAFSRKPIRAATMAGVFIILGGIAYSVFAVYARVVLGQSPQGFTTLILFINFLAGVQLLFLGIIGEYIGRIYEEVKQRPSYIIGEVRGNKSKE